MKTVDREKLAQREILRGVGPMSQYPSLTVSPCTSIPNPTPLPSPYTEGSGNYWLS